MRNIIAEYGFTIKPTNGTLKNKGGPTTVPTQGAQAAISHEAQSSQHPKWPSGAYTFYRKALEFKGGGIEMRQGIRPRNTRISLRPATPSDAV